MAINRNALFYAGQLLVMASAYLLAGKAGLLLAIPPGFATAIFPASGAALAGLLLGGYRLWPGVLIGSVALNLWIGWEARGEITSFSLLVAVGIGLGSCLQAATGSYLVRRAVGFPTPLMNEKDIFCFFGLAGPVSCLVGATVGVSVLTVGQIIPIANAPYTWWIWWVGDVMGILVIIPIAFSFIGIPRIVWRKRRLAVSIPLTILVALIIFIYFHTSSSEIERVSQEFKEQAVLHEKSFQDSLHSHLNSLFYLRSLFNNVEKITQQRFKQVANDLLLMHPGAHAFSWNPRVLAKDRLAYQRMAQVDVSPGFRIVERDEGGRLVPATAREEHVVVQFIEPFAKNKSASGFDVASNPVRKAALDEARDAGGPVATGRINLVQETQKQSGILVFLPVYSGGQIPKSVQARREKIRGFVVGVFRIGEMLTAGMPGADRKNMVGSVYDISSDVDGKVLLAEFGEGESLRNSSESKLQMESPDSAFWWSETFEFGGRRWRFDLAPTSGAQYQYRSTAAWVVLAGGLLFASLLGGFLLVITGRTVQIEMEVQDRTREVLDITRDLRDRGQRIRAVHDTVVDGIITIDDMGIVETVNPAVEQIFGYVSEEIVGQNVRMLMPEPYRGGHDGYVSNFLNTGDAKVIGIGREVVGQRKDGSTFPMDLAVNEMRIGSQRMFTGIVRDITERKMVDQMKSDFISTVSHELRTPLASIVGYSDLILDGDAGEVSNEAEQFVEIISNNAVRLTELINDLLDIEKMESGKVDLDMKTLRLRDILRKVHDTFKLPAEKKGLALDVVDTDDLQLKGDANRLTQVFSNLVSNAIKYTREGSIKINAERQGEEIAVKISDTGIGLSREDTEKLFEKFFRASDEYTRSVGGTGLGLSIAKSIVEEHGGTIEVHSTLGEGTEFSVRLPVANVQSDRTSSITPELRENGDTPKILIIGNNAYPDEAIRTELTSLGVETVFTTNAEEGLRLAGLIKPAMIVLEMLLEHGDGLRVAWRLKKEAQTVNIPVALVSLLPDGNGSMRMGASSFVPKQVLAMGTEGFVKSHFGAGGGRVLVIDDDPDFAAIIHLMLQKHRIEGDIASSGAKALELCGWHSYDLILMDFHLPDMTGSEILNSLRYDLSINTPVVMMSGATIEKGEQREVPMMMSGKIPESSVQIVEIARLFNSELNRGT